MSDRDDNDHNQKDYCTNNPKLKLQDVCEYSVNTQEKCSKYTEKICEISVFSDLYTTTSKII